MGLARVRDGKAEGLAKAAGCGVAAAGCGVTECAAAECAGAVWGVC